jgi:hypothetical protein
MDREIEVFVQDLLRRLVHSPARVELTIVDLGLATRPRHVRSSSKLISLSHGAAAKRL